MDSHLRVLHHPCDDDRIHVGAGGGLVWRIRRALGWRWRARRRRGWRTGNPVLHSFGCSSAHIVSELNHSDADLLNLHWINQVLSVRDIGRITKPFIWTIHDMWPFCGGEHYAPDDADARFRQGYRRDNRPPHERGPDLNRRAWQAKRRAWRSQRFTLVSPSRWLAGCARGSALFAEATVEVIPNTLDTQSVWKPLSREVARQARSLPTAGELVLMGADGGLRDPRKGGDLLLEALRHGVASGGLELELMICGQPEPSSKRDWPCPCTGSGR